MEKRFLLSSSYGFFSFNIPHENVKNCVFINVYLSDILN